MNNEGPIRDQAEKLRKRINEINTTESVEKTKPGEKLPPRSRVHKQKQKQKKTKIKVKYPLLRILGLFFVLLPIVIFSVYTYNNTQKKAGTEPVTTDNKGYETVNINENEQEMESTSEAEEEPVLEDKQMDAKEETNSEETNSEETTNTDSLEGGNTTSDQPIQDNTTASESNVGTGQNATNVVKEETVIYHTVQPKETLYRIAKKYYHSPEGIETIKKANSLKSNEIKVGQKLTIPLSK